MDESTERKLLALIGLGVRGRLAIVGVAQVRDAARRGKLALAVVANDAARNSLEKVIPLLEAKRVTIVAVSSAASLGAAVGREATAAVGVVDRQLARGISSLAGSSPTGARRAGSPGAL